MKIKNILMVGLIFFSIINLCSLVLAETESQGSVSLDQFYQEPTTENFNKLSSVDKQYYVDSQLDVTRESDFEIAQEYFVNDYNVNLNKDKFRQFMVHQGINLIIEEGQGITGYTPVGALTGVNGKIEDVNQFKYLDVQIKVDPKGNLILVDSREKDWVFTGDLKAEEDGFLILDRGTVGGKDIENGRFQLSRGQMIGTADDFSGIKFSEKTEFSFDQKTNMLILVDAKIESISPKTDIMIYGQNILLPGQDKINSGTLTFKDGRAVKVGSGSDVIVGGFNHITDSDKELNLFYAKSSELAEIDRKEEADLKKVSQKYFGTDVSPKSEQEIVKEINDKKVKINDLETEIAQVTKEISKLGLEGFFPGPELASLDLVGIETPEMKLAKLIERDDQLQKEKKIANDDLRKTTNQYLPYLIETTTIQRNYQIGLHKSKPSRDITGRDEVYDNTVIPAIKSQSKNENYFIYGNRRIWLGGEGFVSKTEENNPTFPEFTKINVGGVTRTNLGRLEFKPENGEIDVEKVSFDGQPLALKTKTKGQTQINNGKWEFSSDGNQIYGKTVSDDFKGIENLVSSDMRFEYTDENNQNKYYDLNVDSAYYPPLTNEEYNSLNQEKDKLQSEIKFLISEMGPDKINAVLEMDQKLEDLIGDPHMQGSLIYWKGQRERALKTGSDPKIIAKTELELQKVQNKINLLLQEKQNLNTDVDSQKLNSYTQNIQKLAVINIQLEHRYGEQKTGAFGQVISSKDGDAVLSYEEFIEGFAVINNNNVYKYSTEVYDPGAGVTVGRGRLRVPEIEDTNADLLNLDIMASSQECIDTQFRLAYEYALKTGKDICYDNGGTCLSQFKNKPENFIKGWMSNRGVASYTGGTKKEKEEAGRWDHDIELVSWDDLQPGDVILEQTHARAVKEVIEIEDPPGSGKKQKYYREFAGSMPAISARIYPGLVSVNELKTDQKNGGVVMAYRWKFTGEGTGTKTTNSEESVVPPAAEPTAVAAPEAVPEGVPEVVPEQPALPSTVDPTTLVYPPINIPATSVVKTGKELFGEDARCSDCRYWKENGNFKKSSPSGGVIYPMKIGQIKQLEAAEKQGKFK